MKKRAKKKMRREFRAQRDYAEKMQQAHEKVKCDLHNISVLTRGREKYRKRHRKIEKGVKERKAMKVREIRPRPNQDPS